MRQILPCIGFTLGTLIGGAAPALAETGTQAQIVSEMRAEGYTSIEVSTTWLRRVRIVGEGEIGSREVVINPRNGDVLRDYAAPAEGLSARPDPRRAPPGAVPPPGGMSDRPPGPGKPGAPGGYGPPGGAPGDRPDRPGAPDRPGGPPDRPDPAGGDATGSTGNTSEGE